MRTLFIALCGALTGLLAMAAVVDPITALVAALVTTSFTLIILLAVAIADL